VLEDFYKPSSAKPQKKKKKAKNTEENRVESGEGSSTM
jgi:hypothetical protein